MSTLKERSNWKDKISSLYQSKRELKDITQPHGQSLELLIFLKRSLRTPIVLDSQKCFNMQDTSESAELLSLEYTMKMRKS